MQIWEIGILAFMLIIIVGLFYLIYKYEKSCRYKTATALKKLGLFQQEVSLTEAVYKFFLKTFDYKTRASMSEYWWIVLCISLPLYIISIINYNVSVFFWLILLLPKLSLHVRRFKDVNISPVISMAIFIILPVVREIGAANFNGGWVLWFLLLGIIAFSINLWVVFRASDPYKNRFGEVPNVNKLSASKSVTKTKTNFLQKIYFNVFKNIGNIRLLLILGCLFGGISLFNELDTYYFQIWNLLWVVFWFYLPFIIVLPIKFIIDGYNKDKK